MYVGELLKDREVKLKLDDITPDDYIQIQDDIKEIQRWKRDCPIWKKWCTLPDISIHIEDKS